MNVNGQPQTEHFVNREEPSHALNRRIVDLQNQSARLEKRRVSYHITCGPARI